MTKQDWSIQLSCNVTIVLNNYQCSVSMCAEFRPAFENQLPTAREGYRPRRARRQLESALQTPLRILADTQASGSISRSSYVVPSLLCSAAKKIIRLARLALIIGGPCCPHLYGASAVSSIVHQAKLRRLPDGSLTLGISWPARMLSCGWLFSFRERWQKCSVQCLPLLRKFNLSTRYNVKECHI